MIIKIKMHDNLQKNINCNAKLRYRYDVYVFSNKNGFVFFLEREHMNKYFVFFVFFFSPKIALRAYDRRVI